MFGIVFLMSKIFLLTKFFIIQGAKISTFFGFYYLLFDVQICAGHIIYDLVIENNEKSNDIIFLGKTTLGFN